MFFSSFFSRCNWTLSSKRLVPSTSPKRDPRSRRHLSIPLASEEADREHWRIRLRLRTLLDQADMFLKLQPILLKNKTSRDGLCLKLDVLRMIWRELIRIRHMILVHPLGSNLTRRILRQELLTSGLRGEIILLNRGLSRTWCKEAPQSSCTIPNTEAYSIYI